MEKPSSPVFQFIAGNLALDFINTIDNRLGEAKECLTDSAAFTKWARAAGLIGKTDELTLTQKQLKTIRTIREELHHIFQSLASGSSVSIGTLEPLNARLAKIAAKRQLSCKKGAVKWEWNTSPDDGDRIIGPILLCAADLFVSGLSAKVGLCDGATCGWLFLDQSRARRRRWCSMADCGNREKARRHYNKKK